jgi:hypothetical protein
LCPKHYFFRKYCGAKFVWEVQAGAVVLKVQLRGTFALPTSLNWLRLLDYENSEYIHSTNKEGNNWLFDKDMRHILWCSSPGCKASLGTRRLRMMEVFLERTAEMAHINLDPTWSLVTTRSGSILGGDEAIEIPTALSLEAEVLQECEEVWGYGYPTIRKRGLETV